jgi:hypothetical protein
MTIIELGALGEFVGAIAVVATLAYLAIQIRQNTHSMEESRRLALAQTYQIRADALQQMLVQASESEYIGPIITKLTVAGYPEYVASLEQLTPEERGRFRQWQIAQQTHWDNMYYQYQQGFLDDEYYRDSFRERVRRLGSRCRSSAWAHRSRRRRRPIERLSTRVSTTSIGAAFVAAPCSAH